MAWFFLFLALGLATQLWLCFRVARSSVPWAVATLVFGALGAAYTLFRQRGDEETNVTVPFVANLVFSLLLLMSGVSLLTNLTGHDVPAVETAAAEPAAEPGPAAMPVALASNRAAALAMPQLVPSDAVDALANDLRAVGVTSTVVRLPSTAKLPAGVRAAAQIDMLPRASAAPATGGAAPGLSATFLLCDGTATCRSVAQGYMLQDAASRPRVLQNGAMVLLIAGGRSAATEDLHRMVASTFRQLPQRQ